MTLADRLTVSRVVLIAPLLLLLARGDDIAALALYVAAAITDYADGRVARARQEFSAFGKMLDPIADKLLVAAILLEAAWLGRLSVVGIVAALVIVLREIFVSGLREHLALAAVTVPVTRLAKWKTAAQMVAVGGVLAVPLARGLPPVVDTALTLAAMLSAVTGASYARAFRPGGAS